MYGLGDAPLGWQLSLGCFSIEDTGAIQSRFDENFYFGMEGPCDVAGLASTHVDDAAVGASKAWLDKMFKALVDRFGGASRNSLPFTHTGIQYSKQDRGQYMEQNEFCQTMRPHVFTKERASRDSALLLPQEVTSLRAIIGGLLWICQTRLDVICDTVLLQQDVNTSTVGTLKMANSALTKAKKYAEHEGIIFPYITGPLTIAAIGDSSHASKEISYAQEGVIIALMEDKRLTTISSDSPHFRRLTNGEAQLCGCCHILAHSSHKSKRVSSSTSTSESLAATATKELAQLCALRLTEVLSTGIALPLKTTATVAQMTRIVENAEYAIPIDHFTDCMELFQLAVGEKGVPQDKYQRLYILGIREDLVKGHIRNFLWIPTSGMLADPLTKPMICAMLYELLTYGFWRCRCLGKKGRDDVQCPAIAGPLRLTSYSENDLLKMGSV